MLLCSSTALLWWQLLENQKKQRLSVALRTATWTLCFGKVLDTRGSTCFSIIIARTPSEASISGTRRQQRRLSTVFLSLTYRASTCWHYMVVSGGCSNEEDVLCSDPSLDAAVLRSSHKEADTRFVLHEVGHVDNVVFARDTGVLLVTSPGSSR